MEKPTLKEKLKTLWETIAPAMSYRSKPGCTACMSPIMDESGKPAVPHCSQTQEK